MTTRALNDVIREIEAVQAKIEGLKIQADEATTEADQLNNVSHDELIANPASAEKIATKVMAKNRLAEAYGAKIAEHETEIQQLRLKALEVEADLFDKDAERLDKELAKHEAKTDELLDKLRKHDRVKYVPDDDGPLPHSASIRGQANANRYKAAMNRYYLQTGEITYDVHELRKVIESSPQHGGHLLLLSNPMILGDKASDLLLAVRDGRELELHPA